MSTPNAPPPVPPGGGPPHDPRGGGRNVRSMTLGLDPRVAGALHGMFAAVLGAAPLLGLPFATALSFFAAMPIFYVGFAKGPMAVVIAAVVAIGATALAAAPLAGLTLAANTVVPAAYAAFLINLARPAEELGGPDGGLAWYPLADVLLRLCLTVAAGTVVVGLAIGYEIDAVRDAFVKAFGSMEPLTDAEGAPLLPDLADPEGRERLAGALARLLPLAQPFSAVIVLVGNLHLAAQLARARGVLKRPRDDMALALRLPTLGLLAFGIAIALSFGDGETALAARAFAGAFGAGFTIAGFAIIHLWLRGSAARLPVLVGLYVATLVTAGLTVLPVMALGLFSTARAVPVSKRND